MVYGSPLSPDVYDPYNPHDVYSDKEEEEDDSANYKCVSCENRTHIENEHKQFAQNWCSADCDEITTHKRIE